MSEERRIPGFVVAATGLRAEARIAARSAHVRAIAGGGAADEFERQLRQTITAGAEAIISFGIAAGLAPGRGAGTCLIGSEVVHAGKRYAADPAWTAGLKAHIDGAELATIAGIDRVLPSSADKQALHVRTGAVAADMESHIVAQLAAEHRLPFAVLRVIADPVWRELPPAALVGMRPDGGVNVRGVLAALALSPTQLPALIRLAADTRLAFAELFRCYRLLGPRLGFGDLS